MIASSPGTLNVTPIKGLRWVEPTNDLIEKTPPVTWSNPACSVMSPDKRRSPTDLVLVVDLRALYVNLENQAPESVDVALSLRLIDRLQKQPLGCGTCPSTSLQGTGCDGHHPWLSGGRLPPALPGDFRTADGSCIPSAFCLA